MNEVAEISASGPSLTVITDRSVSTSANPTGRPIMLSGGHLLPHLQLPVWDSHSIRSRLRSRFDSIDTRITAWMAAYGVLLTRIALGIVFLWFGAIKFIPDWSPAAELATRTISALTFDLVPPNLSLPLLAAWESFIGIGLLSGRYLRATLLLLFVQMPGTAMPLFLFSGETFSAFPYAPTMEGQYIIKNLVLVAAAIVVGATVRGGRLTSKPDGGAIAI